jgi:hypothetical protein
MVDVWLCRCSGQVMEQVWHGGERLRGLKAGRGSRADWSCPVMLVVVQEGFVLVMFQGMGGLR